MSYAMKGRRSPTYSSISSLFRTSSHLLFYLRRLVSFIHSFRFVVRSFVRSFSDCMLRTYRSSAGSMEGPMYRWMGCKENADPKNGKLNSVEFLSEGLGCQRGSGSSSRELGGLGRCSSCAQLLQLPGAQRPVLEVIRMDNLVVGEVQRAIHLLEALVAIVVGHVGRGARLAAGEVRDQGPPPVAEARVVLVHQLLEVIGDGVPGAAQSVGILEIDLGRVLLLLRVEQVDDGRLIVGLHLGPIGQHLGEHPPRIVPDVPIRPERNDGVEEIQRPLAVPDDHVPGIETHEALLLEHHLLRPPHDQIVLLVALERRLEHHVREHGVAVHPPDPLGLGVRQHHGPDHGDFPPPPRQLLVQIRHVVEEIHVVHPGVVDLILQGFEQEVRPSNFMAFPGPGAADEQDSRLGPLLISGVLGSLHERSALLVPVGDVGVDVVRDSVHQILLLLVQRPHLRGLEAAIDLEADGLEHLVVREGEGAVHLQQASVPRVLPVAGDVRARLAAREVHAQRPSVVAEARVRVGHQVLEFLRQRGPVPAQSETHLQRRLGRPLLLLEDQQVRQARLIVGCEILRPIGEHLRQELARRRAHALDAQCGPGVEQIQRPLAVADGHVARVDPDPALLGVQDLLVPVEEEVRAVGCVLVERHLERHVRDPRVAVHPPEPVHLGMVHHEHAQQRDFGPPSVEGWVRARHVVEELDVVQAAVVELVLGCFDVEVVADGPGARSGTCARDEHDAGFPPHRSSQVGILLRVRRSLLVPVRVHGSEGERGSVPQLLAGIHRRLRCGFAPLLLLLLERHHAQFLVVRLVQLHFRLHHLDLAVVVI
ncbi:hypothetical protein Mapa_005388 [Marchantia paleacea]|nr:hypothetical protein Mapa_005388 [Marchantia paleacea]